MSEATAPDTHLLDTRGLLCPMPVIRTQNLVKKLPRGDIVHVIGSDPGILHDIPAWCRINGHHLQSTSQKGREYHVVLQIGAE